jgi:hypothetical protein
LFDWKKIIGPGNLVIIEWFENVREFFGLEREVLKVRLDSVSDQSEGRKIMLEVA